MKKENKLVISLAIGLLITGFMVVVMKLRLLYATRLA